MRQNHLLPCSPSALPPPAQPADLLHLQANGEAWAGGPGRTTGSGCAPADWPGRDRTRPQGREAKVNLLLFPTAREPRV